jgi:hypothetical protein
VATNCNSGAGERRGIVPNSPLKPEKSSVFNKYCVRHHIRVDLEGTTRYPNTRMGLMAGADLLAMFSGQVLKLFTL